MPLPLPEVPMPFVGVKNPAQDTGYGRFDARHWSRFTDGSLCGLFVTSTGISTSRCR